MLPPGSINDGFARAAREALDAGDSKGLRQLIAEEALRVAPNGPPVSDELIRLMELFHSVDNTEVVEDAGRFAAFMAEVQRTFSAEVVTGFLGVMLLSSGVIDGGLPAVLYDAMLEFLDTVGAWAGAERYLPYIERRDE